MCWLLTGTELMQKVYAWTFSNAAGRVAPRLLPVDFTGKRFSPENANTKFVSPVDFCTT